MDPNALKIFADLGTVGILLYILISLLSGYRAAFERVADLLENMIDDNSDSPSSK